MTIKGLTESAHWGLVFVAPFSWSKEVWDPDPSRRLQLQVGLYICSSCVRLCGLVAGEAAIHRLELALYAPVGDADTLGILRKLRSETLHNLLYSRLYPCTSNNPSPSHRI